MKIRECTREDKDIWIRLNREFMAFEIQDNDLWDEAQAPSDERFGETFEEALANREMIVLMFIEHEGSVIGFANLMIIYSVWAHGKAMILDDFFIEEKWRGRGLGKKALAELERFAEEKGMKRFQFHSETTNPGAREFYRAASYTPTEMYFYRKNFRR